MNMDTEKRRALEAAGFRVGNAEDFLGLSQDERAFVELRMTVSRKIRSLRKQCNLTQTQLGAKIHSSQSRIAKMEAGAKDVSLDLLFRGLFALGGTVQDLTS